MKNNEGTDCHWVQKLHKCNVSQTSSLYQKQKKKQYNSMQQHKCQQAAV